MENNTSAKKKIILIQLAGLGDLVLASGAIAALAKKYPRASIDLLTYRSNALLVKDCYLINRIFCFDHFLTRQTIQTLKDLSAIHYDEAINLFRIHTWRGSINMNVLFKLISFSESIGRNTNNKGYFYTQRVDENYPMHIHETETHKKLLALAGVHQMEPPCLWIKSDREGLQDFLKKEAKGSVRELICLHIGARKVSHQWGAERFAQLTKLIHDNNKGRVILTGGQQDKAIAKRIKVLTQRKIIDATGCLSLAQWVALIDTCRMVVTNETGPMHLAALRETPLVILSGNSPDEFLPLKRDQMIILKKESCQPRNRCSGLRQITPVDVFEVMEKLLSRDPDLVAGCVDLKERTKVLHVHTRAIVAGSSKNMKTVLKNCPLEFYEKHIACGLQGYWSNFRTEFEETGIVLHAQRHLRNPIHPIWDLRSLIDLIKLIQREQFRIVHTHNSKAGVLGRLAAKLCGVPVIIHTHHSCHFHYEGLSPFKVLLYRQIERFMGILTDSCIAVSRHIREEYLKYRLISPEKIVLIYGGVDIGALQKEAGASQTRKELDLDDRYRLIGVIARCEEEKGQRDILQAIPAVVYLYPETIFLFVGDGSKRNEFEDMARKMKLKPHVRFVGFRRDIPRIIHAIDILCTAPYYEGMGQIYLEAQAAGKPICATFVGGIPDIVMDQETGFLVKPRNPDAISAVLTKLLKDEGLRRTMGQKGKEHVSKNFTESIMVEKTLGLYQRLLEKKRLWTSEK